MIKSNRGGKRAGAGRPALSPEQKRVTHSIVLSPGIRELAQELAQELGLPGWGWAVDEAIRKLAKELLNE